MMHIPFPVMQSEHLLFRPFQYTDVASVYQLFSDPETMRFDGGEILKDWREAIDFIQIYSVYYPGIPQIRWAVELREDRRFIGSCGFHSIDYVHKKAEIGGELMKPFRHRGLAEEGMRQLVDFGFATLKLNRLTAKIATLNKAANALMEKSPFTFEGCLKQWERWGDTWVDVNVYRLLRSEWRLKR